LKFLEEYNVKFVLAIDFNEGFKQIPPIDFLHAIEDKINVKGYMSGKDFRFGANAKGKSSTLKNYAEDEENGVWYTAVKDVVLNDEKISTTLIKSCLSEGNVAKANTLLGENFYVEGEVISGAGRGKEIGFPTINIAYPDYKYEVKQGVYKVKSTINGLEYYGIANYGNCPTFDDERIALEVHFDGFEGDLYGQDVKVEFVDYIRDIAKFDSAEALAAQLESDLQTLKD
jgi:riboflavin kinase/FMN adenylyltransferase